MARGDSPPTIIPPMVTRLIIKTEIPFSTATNRAIGMMTATISPPAPAAEMIAPKRKKITGRIFAFPLARHTMFLESACVVPFKVAIPKRNVVARTIKNTLVGQFPVTTFETLISVPHFAAAMEKMYAATRPTMPAFFFVTALKAITAIRTIKDATAIMMLEPPFSAIEIRVK